jgi:hypothetical protein
MQPTDQTSIEPVYLKSRVIVVQKSKCLLSRTHQQFGGSIILGYHFVSHVCRCVRFIPNTSQTEITNLQDTVAVDQQISGLDVSETKRLDTGLCAC